MLGEGVATVVIGYNKMVKYPYAEQVQSLANLRRCGYVLTGWFTGSTGVVMRQEHRSGVR